MGTPNLPRHRPAIVRTNARGAGSYAVLGLVVISLCALLSVAHAGPTGGTVAAGAASITSAGGRTDILQSSNRAVIDWRGFSIGRGEQVSFAQPSASSVALNRVTGGETSAILGQLSANGHVFLINANGIVFGREAQVNVGGLVASTADIRNADFMVGRLAFDMPGKPNARIVNEGSITVREGGLVALVAPGVENTGVISARLGKVALVAGDVFTLDLYGDRLIQLGVHDERFSALRDAAGIPLHHWVAQSGEIRADGGQVALQASTAAGILDGVINLSGVIQARTVGNRKGAITLEGDAGTAIGVAGIVDASGSMGAEGGGAVAVFGGTVDIGPSARLDVSAPGDGGVVLVGGDYRGQGDATNARSSRVEQGARISADSLVGGNGGRVVVRSDGDTRFDGAISARGGPGGGDGGFVEVSGKCSLAFNGDVTAAAPQGRPGELLLDPGNLRVVDARAAESLGPSSGGAFSLTADAPDSNISGQKINKLLIGGTSVTLEAGNDLYVNYRIDGRNPDGTTQVAGAGVTLRAGKNVWLNDNVITDNGPISIFARDGDVTAAPNSWLVSGTGNISVETGESGVAGVGGSVALDWIITEPGASVSIVARAANEDRGGYVVLRQDFRGADYPPPRFGGALVVDADRSVDFGYRVRASSLGVNYGPGPSDCTVDCFGFRFDKDLVASSDGSFALRYVDDNPVEILRGATGTGGVIFAEIPAPDPGGGLSVPSPGAAFSTLDPPKNPGGGGPATSQPEQGNAGAFSAVGSTLTEFNKMVSLENDSNGSVFGPFAQMGPGPYPAGASGERWVLGGRGVASVADLGRWAEYGAAGNLFGLNFSIACGGSGMGDGALPACSP